MHASIYFSTSRPNISYFLSFVHMTMNNVYVFTEKHPKLVHFSAFYIYRWDTEMKLQEWRFIYQKCKLNRYVRKRDHEKYCNLEEWIPKALQWNVTVTRCKHVYYWRYNASRNINVDGGVYCAVVIWGCHEHSGKWGSMVDMMTMMITLELNCKLSNVINLCKAVQRNTLRF